MDLNLIDCLPIEDLLKIVDDTYGDWLSLSETKDDNGLDDVFLKMKVDMVSVSFSKRKKTSLKIIIFYHSVRREKVNKKKNTK
jgi:hypothetical protein